jgi:hypothetical protein
MCRNKIGRPFFHLIGQFHSHPGVTNKTTPVSRRKWLEGARVNFLDMTLEPFFALFGPLANIVPTRIPDVWWWKPRNLLWQDWEKSD